MLLGQTIDWQYYAYGGAYNGSGSPWSFVVGSGSGQFQSYFDILANDTQITFDYGILGNGTTWSPSSPS